MHEALKPRSSIESLRDPVLIAAFAGWNDNGGGAVATMAYLVEQWGATELADIDPHQYYDFTVQRPRVSLVDGERTIDWPHNRFYVASPPGAERDFLLLGGVEPHLRWRSFTELIEDMMRAVGAQMSITIGAQPAAVPHTRPLPVTLSASAPAFEERFGLRAPASRYQGPTGIVGVLNLHHRALGWDNASLWAQVPHYLTVGPNPNVTISIVRMLDRGFHTVTSLDPLERRAEEFEARVREAMGDAPDAAGYMKQLEEQYDAERPALLGSEGGADEELPEAGEIVEDLDRFFRDNSPGTA